MSTKATNGARRDLKPIEYDLTGLCEEPTVCFESNSEFAWLQFDEAMKELDAKTAPQK